MVKNGVGRFGPETQKSCLRTLTFALDKKATCKIKGKYVTWFIKCLTNESKLQAALRVGPFPDVVHSCVHHNAGGQAAFPRLPSNPFLIWDWFLGRKISMSAVLCFGQSLEQKNKQVMHRSVIQPVPSVCSVVVVQTNPGKSLFCVTIENLSCKWANLKRISTCLFFQAKRHQSSRLNTKLNETYTNKSDIANGKKENFSELYIYWWQRCSRLHLSCLPSRHLLYLGILGEPGSTMWRFPSESNRILRFVPMLRHSAEIHLARRISKNPGWAEKLLTVIPLRNPMDFFTSGQFWDFPDFTRETKAAVYLAVMPLTCRWKASWPRSIWWTTGTSSTWCYWPELHTLSAQSDRCLASQSPTCTMSPVLIERKDPMFVFFAKQKSVFPNCPGDIFRFSIMLPGCTDLVSFVIPEPLSFSSDVVQPNPVAFLFVRGEDIEQEVVLIQVLDWHQVRLKWTTLGLSSFPRERFIRRRDEVTVPVVRLPSRATIAVNACKMPCILRKKFCPLRTKWCMVITANSLSI